MLGGGTKLCHLTPENVSDLPFGSFGNGRITATISMRNQRFPFFPTLQDALVFRQAGLEARLSASDKVSTETHFARGKRPEGLWAHQHPAPCKLIEVGGISLTPPAGKSLRIPNR